MRIESVQVVAVPKLPKLFRHGCAKNSGGIEETTQQSPVGPILDINWECVQSKLVFQKWEVFSRVGSVTEAQHLAGVLGCQNPAK